MTFANLQQKLDSLSTFAALDSYKIKTLGEILRKMPDKELFRINPLEFAKNQDWDPKKTIELFIHGAKVGLFDFDWHQICPICGSTEFNPDGINELSTSFYCTLCRKDFACDLDDRVEISFSINPNVKKIVLDPYQDMSNYFHYYCSTCFQPSRGYEKYVDEMLKDFFVLDDDELKTLTLDVKAGELITLVSFDNHSTFLMPVADTSESTPQTLQLDALPAGFSPGKFEAKPGSITIVIHNRTTKKMGVILLYEDTEYHDSTLERDPNKLGPFFSAKMLLNHQSFRELFRIDNLKPDLRLNLRNLTILFTDLKGSTQLYDEAGDALAYGLVQEHFDILTDVVSRNSGAIIKTMGDAIMATFSIREDAAQAALEMIADMEPFNQKITQKGHKLGLKIGLHEGPVLAVKANDTIDYFGQAVNISARIQGLAEVGEILVSEILFKEGKVEDIFRQAGYRMERKTAALKGVQEAVVVCRLTLG